MNKKSLLAVLAIFALVSCNNSDMAKITYDRSKELANEILTKQEDSQLFTAPKNFVLKSTSRITMESSNPSSGKEQDNSYNQYIYSIDVNKLIYRYYVKQTTIASSTMHEIIRYYDEGKGKFYILSNDNGYKTREPDEDMTIEQARNLFTGLRNGFEDTYKWRATYIQQINMNPFALDVFSSELDSALAEQERLKDEKDQYCNVFTGSNNGKSLQVKVNEKYKIETDTYIVNSTGTSDVTIKNNLFHSYKASSTSTQTSTIDKRFYYKTTYDLTETMSYDTANISKPNPANYVVSE